MPAITATWLVGSIEGLAAQSIEVDGAGVVPVLSAGNWYLRHANPALSILDQLDAVLTAEIGNATVRVLQNRRIQISSTLVFSIDWSSAPDLPGLLGFSGNLATQNSYIAPAISPLLFSPGYPATSPTGEGQASYPVEDEHTQISAAGDIVDSEYHNVQRHQSFKWSSVMGSRVRASDLTSTLLQGGTWHRFRDRVLLPNYRWQAYEAVTEDSASEESVSWPTALGTYKRRALPKGRYDRVIPNANTRWNLGVEAIEQSEYPANA